MTCISSYTPLIMPAAKFKNVFWYSFYRATGDKWAHETCAGCPQQWYIPGEPSNVQYAAVTLKMRLRLPKYNHLFTLSLLCVFATLVKVLQLVHILKLESTTTPTPTGSAPKAVYQPSPSLSFCFLKLCFMRLLILNFMR